MLTQCLSCTPGDMDAEAEVHTDFLRIVLEVINAVLAGNLAANPELVYALLHRHDVFASLRAHPRCAELLDNIFAVIDFFNAKASAGALHPDYIRMLCSGGLADAAHCLRRS